MAILPAYTVQLFSDSLLPSGSTDIPGPPDGFRYVYTDVTFLHDGQSFQGCRGIYVQDQFGSTVFGVAEDQAYQARPYHWSGRQVQDVGDTWVVVTYDEHWSMRATGFQLSTT